MFTPRVVIAPAYSGQTTTDDILIIMAIVTLMPKPRNCNGTPLMEGLFLGPSHKRCHVSTSVPRSAGGMLVHSLEIVDRGPWH